jgi:hypothetical protein
MELTPMRLRGRLFLHALVLFSLLAGCRPEDSPPPVPFVEPRGDGYAAKIDFAQLEHDLPLRPEDLNKITPDNLKAATQEQVDQIYGRLTAGPIPDGPYEGGAFFPKGSTGQARFAEILGGGLKGRLVNFKTVKLEKVAEAVWKGKMFYRDRRVLRNRIQDLAILEPLLADGHAPIQKLDVDGKDAWLLFPAKLYCGQSLLDGRRESIIIDYAFTDDIDGYREMPDALGGRDGLEIRDEIRMVRPGLYLGRAYMKKVFVLNFTLSSKDAAGTGAEAVRTSGKTDEDCWVGTQRITAMAR